MATNKLKLKRCESSRLEIGNIKLAHIKTVAAWREMSVAQFVAYCKKNSQTLMVGIHKTDDKVVCAHMTFIPSIAEYTGEVTTAQRNELISNLTESHVVWVYTSPEYRNQGYYSEFSNALLAWINTFNPNYEKTTASKITSGDSATYVKQHLVSQNYSTPAAEFEGSDYEEAELTMVQYRSDNP